jgi:hypothetical protein
VEKLNQWMMLAANVGVLAGIVFLAYEIQVNTDAVRSSNYAAFVEGGATWADSQMEYAEQLAAIYALEHTDYERLTGEQQLLLRAFLFKSFTVLESNYLHHRAGSLDDDVFESKIRVTLRSLVGNKWWSQQWQEDHGMAPEFKAWMDKRIDEARADGL